MASSVARISVHQRAGASRPAQPSAGRAVVRAPAAVAPAALRRHKAVVARAEAEEAEAQVADDWTTRYVAGEDVVYTDVAAPEFRLRFLWLPKNIAVAVDQVFASGTGSPLTEYFFWPRKDAWEELKASLETKTWISERDTVLMLNRTTEVINFWQDEGEKHSLEEARDMFPDCDFLGA